MVFFFNSFYVSSIELALVWQWFDDGSRRTVEVRLESVTNDKLQTRRFIALRSRLSEILSISISQF